MSVTAWSRRWKEHIPIRIVYDDLMELIGDEDDELSKGYREKIMGKTCVNGFSIEYLELGIVEDKVMPHSEWRTWDLHDRAKYMARRYLKNMADIIDNHYREQDEENRRSQDELARKQKAGNSGG